MAEHILWRTSQSLAPKNEFSTFFFSIHHSDSRKLPFSKPLLNEKFSIIYTSDQRHIDKYTVIAQIPIFAVSNLVAAAQIR